MKVAILAAAASAYTIKEPPQEPQINITFRGGPVMSEGVNVYNIFYGNWPDSTKGIIKDFVQGLGKSDWWKVTEQYYDDDKHFVNNNVTWKGSYTSHFSVGKNITTDVQLDNIIESASKHARWGNDTNGIYVLYIDPDVAVSGLCDSYCGFHSISNSYKKYALIGDSTACPGTLPPAPGLNGTAGCMPRYWRNHTEPTYSVNKDQRADGLMSTLAHELSETVSDFAGTWYDNDGQENGDKCAGYFNKVQGIKNEEYESAYNVDFGKHRKFLIQSMWSPVSNECLLYPGEKVTIAHSEKPSVLKTASLIDDSKIEGDLLASIASGGSRKISPLY
ncbi:hypothetical protein HDV06_003416 [Boothiomyces sp. JEL0866]|nr:hypothetical protein HDV06_003368 [Boothiomyces sp. JEL0866]KAJ3325646.1 hypothetical protein HDV06_003416 [Boothiomyces sp. JEL0866]